MAGKFCKKYKEDGLEPPEHKGAKWKELVKKLADMHGRPVCGAKVQDGWPCERHPLPDRTRCRQHGGMSPPAGPLHHAFVNGRYSKALGGRSISDMYEQARNDPNLLALREEIALLVAKQQETLSRLPAGNSREFMDQLTDLFGMVVSAMRRGADGEMTSAMDNLGKLIAEGSGEHHIWDEYTGRTEQIRKLVDTERKHQEAMRQYLPIERLGVITAVWLDIMRRTIPREHLAVFHDELRRVRGMDVPMTGREVGSG